MAIMTIMTIVAIRDWFTTTSNAYMGSLSVMSVRLVCYHSGPGVGIVYLELIAARRVLLGWVVDLDFECWGLLLQWAIFLCLLLDGETICLEGFEGLTTIAKE